MNEAQSQKLDKIKKLWKEDGASERSTRVQVADLQKAILSLRLYILCVHSLHNLKKALQMSIP